MRATDCIEWWETSHKIRRLGDLVQLMNKYICHYLHIPILPLSVSDHYGGIAPSLSITGGGKPVQCFSAIAVGVPQGSPESPAALPHR